MSSVRLALAGFLTVAVLGGSAANARAEKPTTNKDKIVGVWEFVKSSDPKSRPRPPARLSSSTKDGKFEVRRQDRGQSYSRARREVHE